MMKLTLDEMPNIKVVIASKQRIITNNLSNTIVPVGDEV